VSHLLDDGNWTDPVNLGSKINAGRYDGSPFLASDGKTLYFSSNRDGGKGGVDLYQSTWIGPSDTDWSEPIDLPVPINSEKNDFFLSMPATGKTVYFASDRTGKTKLDLWVASPPSNSSHPFRTSNVQISIDPNPAVQSTHVRFSVPKDKGYSFSIEDLTGHIVKICGAANSQQGGMDVDVSAIPPGVYLFVTTLDSGERDTQRLVVIK
jgi:hypothetical protein